MLCKCPCGTQDGCLNAYFFAVQMMNMPKMVHVRDVLAAVWMAKELVSAQVSSSSFISSCAASLYLSLVSFLCCMPLATLSLSLVSFLCCMPLATPSLSLVFLFAVCF